MISSNIPDELRDYIKTHLMTLEQDAKIGIEENDLVAVRKDILQFWSSYFRGAFHKCWNQGPVIVFRGNHLSAILVYHGSLYVLGEAPTVRKPTRA